MQFFGLRVAGVHIALFGGLSASFFLAVSALIHGCSRRTHRGSGVAAHTLHTSPSRRAASDTSFARPLLAGISVTAA